MSAKPNKVRVAVIDDHPVLRHGVSQLVSSQNDYELVGQADDAKKAITLVQQTKPDVVILDVSLKGVSGIETVKDLRAIVPHLKILMLSMLDENIYAPRALKAGAAGYIMKQEPPERLLIALNKVASGQIYVSDRYAGRLLNSFAGGRTDAGTTPVDCLSDRELEVFTLIGQGHGTRAIAEKLGLSVKTIESHRAHIKEKLNLEGATDLVHYAIQWQSGEKLMAEQGAE